ncbi:DUF2853 family protein [Parvularcula oceani]|uniref:DUF2853 family protein n=1 Tax=Parvularcula oceani TaxID=1247963 RepID=UPI0004E14101|nr:DUF2853 family protein [Parvularcula oceani]
MLDGDRYLSDVRAYDAAADSEKVEAIVRRLGIALSTRGGRYVSCEDRAELLAIRDGFAKKRLRLDESRSDEEIMTALLAVCARMAQARKKHRVAFYYLLASETGTLDRL